MQNYYLFQKKNKKHFCIKSIISKEINSSSRRALLISGIFVGLALLSKYHSFFLWVGAILYILFFNRKWLNTKELYISIFISLLIFLPVLIWNYQNQFISFTFQGERVNIISSGIRLDYFITELIGEVFYTNPVTFALILIAIFKFKTINETDTDIKRFLLIFSLPNILIFLLFSLFRKTLPHWTGPGYLVLLILTAIYISEKRTYKIFQIPISIFISYITILIVLVLGYLQINYSFIPQKKTTSLAINLGKDDITLDMFGWKQILDKFKKLNDKYVEENVFGINVPIISNKWYNAGHLDYYVGRIMNKNIYSAGNLNDIRNYIFVNRNRGDLLVGEDAYYISPSRDFRKPDELLSLSFEKIIPLDTIKVYRAGEVAENVFIFKLRKYTGNRFY